MGVVNITCGKIALKSLAWESGPVVSTVLALPMPTWKRCSKFLEHWPYTSLVPPGPLFICVFRGPGTRSHVTLGTI